MNYLLTESSGHGDDSVCLVSSPHQLGPTVGDRWTFQSHSGHWNINLHCLRAVRAMFRAVHKYQILGPRNKLASLQNSITWFQLALRRPLPVQNRLALF